MASRSPQIICPRRSPAVLTFCLTFVFETRILPIYASIHDFKRRRDDLETNEIELKSNSWLDLGSDPGSHSAQHGNLSSGRLEAHVELQLCLITNSFRARSLTHLWTQKNQGRRAQLCKFKYRYKSMERLDYISETLRFHKILAKNLLSSRRLWNFCFPSFVDVSCLPLSPDRSCKIY